MYRSLLQHRLEAGVSSLTVAYRRRWLLHGATDAGDRWGVCRDSAQMLPLTVHGIVPTMLATISDRFTGSHTMTVSALASATSAVIELGARWHGIALIIVRHDQYFKPSVSPSVIGDPIGVQDLDSTGLLTCAWHGNLLRYFTLTPGSLEVELWAEVTHRPRRVH